MQLSKKFESIKESQLKFQVQEKELEELREENAELRMKVQDLEQGKETELMMMKDQMQNSIEEQIVQR